MLSEQQINQDKREGYTVQHSLLSPPDVKAMLAEIDSICGGATLANHDVSRMEMESNQAPEGTLVRRIYEPCTYYSRFRSLSESTELLDCLQQLLGKNLTFHYSKINVKPPSIGSVVEWHQDLTYYPLTNNDSLAFLIYLDDASRRNSCLQVIPGRHLEPVMDHTTAGFFQGRITKPIDESKGVFVEGKPGTAVFMHGKTPHSSAPNSSLEPRRTLILSYRAADAFPLYIGDQTKESEAHVRHVRGEAQRAARLTSGKFPIPQYPAKTKSLYELQELSRSGHASADQIAT